MPIRPENMPLYPGGSIRSPEWLVIRERIRERADNRCEGCGVGNHSLIWRDRAGEILDYAMRPDDRLHGRKPTRVVCTVAHVDGKLIDHSDANLAFWCQRCHNRHDAKSRQANAAITRHEKRGQPDLLGRV